MDIRTRKEKERDSRHAAICEEYLRIAGMYPAASQNRMLNAVARKFGMTSAGVKNIIKAKGLYDTARNGRRRAES